MFDYLLQALTPFHVLLALGGVIAGTVIGSIPGLTATMAVAVLVPITFSMAPASALILMGAAFLAIAMGFRNIYLAGFSGYGEPHRDKPMDDFFQLLRDDFPGLKVRAVTPTLYGNVRQFSIYGL